MLGQQAQGPARLAFGRHSASEREEPRRARAIEATGVPALARGRQQGCRETLLDEALAYALAGAQAEMECGRRLLVGAARLGFRLVHWQQ